MHDQNQDIKNRNIEIKNYIKALKAIICLRKFVIENLKGEFFFVSKLNYAQENGRKPQTPDFISKLSDSVWVGDIKKSLANPDFPNHNFGSEKEYVEKFIEKELISQLKKYDEPFKELDVEKHDLVLFAPNIDYRAIGYLKVKYLQAKKDAGEAVFKNNFAILIYSIEQAANNTEFILIRLDEPSKLSNKTATDDLTIGYRKFLGEIKEELGKFKVYEESDKTPFEYIMTLLWTSIFPDLMEKSEVNKIIEWRSKKENVFEFKFSALISYLQTMYVLPSLNSDIKQFDSSGIKTALNAFYKITFNDERSEQTIHAVLKLDNNSDPTYRVTYRSLPEKDELAYILKKVYNPDKGLPVVSGSQPTLI